MTGIYLFAQNVGTAVKHAVKSMYLSTSHDTLVWSPIMLPVCMRDWDYYR